MPRPASPRTKRLITKLTKGWGKELAEFARTLFSATTAEDLEGLHADSLKALTQQAKSTYDG